jgi:lipopolysaccharide/colanic/teichoic acid biosynthesis glycosyltransferase
LIAKRTLDALASIAGLVLLAPLLVSIAVWIKLDSSGPVFFRQERVGRRGRPFRIWKFRTMCVDSECVGPQLTVGADPRITRAGRFLRRYKLDELPQLLNVLCGEMSLVGPRPEVPRYVARYSERQRAQILAVRPGITDPASIVFVDENDLLSGASDPERVYVESVLPNKLRLYEAYLAQRSFWGDVRLIFRTLAIAARRTRPPAGKDARRSME